MSRLAVLEIYHSRPIAPTRRVALGTTHLPASPAPGPGGILLAGVVAAHITAIDPDLIPEVVRLSHDVEEGRRIAQPRLRYRFQVDRVGLQRSRAVLLGRGEAVEFDLSELRGAPEQHLLGALYAMQRLEPADRAPVAHAVRRGIGWSGPLDGRFVAALTGASAGGLGPAVGVDPRAWALGVLGFEPLPADGAGSTAGPSAGPTGGSSAGAAGLGASEDEVRSRFRRLLREAHPDHGGAIEHAAARIAELTEARRILTGA